MKEIELTPKAEEDLEAINPARLNPVSGKVSPHNGIDYSGYTDLMVDGAPSPHQSDTTLRWLIDRLRS